MAAMNETGEIWEMIHWLFNKNKNTNAFENKQRRK